MIFENEWDFKHNYTDELVCPWCGYEFMDSWEYENDGEELGLVDCNNCGKQFYGYKNIVINYSTDKAHYGTCPICKDEEIVLEEYDSSCGCHDRMCLDCGKIEQRRLREEYFKRIKG